MKSKLTFLSAAALVLFLHGSAQATTITVSTTNDVIANDRQCSGAFLLIHHSATSDEFRV